MGIMAGAMAESDSPNPPSDAQDASAAIPAAAGAAAGGAIAPAEPPASPAHVLARLYGEPLTELPPGLYIPPDALEVILERFEGPLDLLLWLIRSQKFDVMDIPMAVLTEQYMAYVELIRRTNLELASAYLVMSATLMSIKSRMLLPRARDAQDEEEPEDPRAELMKRLLEYERIRVLAGLLADLPRAGRDFLFAAACHAEALPVAPPVVTADELSVAWESVEEQLSLTAHHRVTREELSVREHMTSILRALQGQDHLRFSDLLEPAASREQVAVWLLASLELGKAFLLSLRQAEPYGEIWLTAGDAPLLTSEGAEPEVIAEPGEEPSSEEPSDEEREAEWRRFFADPGRRGGQGELF